MSESSQHELRGSTSFLAIVLVMGLLLGAVAASYFAYVQMSRLDSRITGLQNEVSRLQGNQTVIFESNTIIQNGTWLSGLYEEVIDSVVLITCKKSDGTPFQGSGFVYNLTGDMVIVTNNHVVSGMVDVSVTFSDGDAYAATVNGTDPYADLAVLSVVGAPVSKFRPLEVVSSSTLRVGDPSIAIGAPYGLAGTMTTGVISALGRTITEEDYTGGFAIANIIQTSTPINPGNSGGPLLNYAGKVVGITTAIVQNAEGLGFAVPSNTIQKEAYALAKFRTYTDHSYLGVMGRDMDYYESQTLGVNVTYGALIAKDPIAGGPAATADIRKNDVIIAMDGTRIRSMDELSSYLEENTLPTQTIIVTVARRNQTTLQTDTLDIHVVLGTRPPPP
jgi:S1-C subfamily serine protease